VPNNTRLRIRSPYPLPKVLAIKPPTLNAYLKTELSSQTKADDKELAKMQCFMFNALGLLAALLESKPKDLSHQEVISATTTAVGLLGNANPKLLYLRRKKVTNKSLLPLIEDDTNSVLPSVQLT